MIKNLTLTLISTLITLIIVEIVLRLFLGHILYTGNKFRQLYYSSPNLEVVKESNNAVHYAPNTPIRSITVYYNEIEYDAKHHTNNMGFVSDVNYTKEEKNGALFIGDSFTAGVGSNKPWLPILNKKYPDINLYSLGVTGTGQENFYRLFENYQDQLNFDTVVILSISDDLRRILWHPTNKNGWLYFCYEGEVGEECKRGKRIAGLIAYDIDSDSLLLPEELYIVKAYGVLKSRYEKFQKTQELQKIKNAQKVAIQKPATSVTQAKAEPPKIIKQAPKKSEISLEYIAKIKELADKRGDKVIFVHIPEKGETQSGRYRYNIEKRIQAMGIEYHPLLKEYKFTMSMFHPHDGHPNDTGYAHISSIIEDILRLKEKQK